jgi:hypothetical protein
MSKNFKEVKKDYWKLRKQLFFNKFKSKNQNKQQLPPASTMSERIAFIIDDEVIDIINCQPRFAAILLSEPLILSLEDKDIAPGWKYIDGKFIPPKTEEEVNEKD